MLKRTPALVAWLGYGGLIPFVALALAAAAGGPYAEASGCALRAYGAVILSFVGALHWGFAMLSGEMPRPERNRAYAWSVIPALLAWAALLSAPTVSCALLAAGFALHYGMDRLFAEHNTLPAWYLPLRLKLTAVACLCLAAGAWTGATPAAAMTPGSLP